MAIRIEESLIGSLGKIEVIYPVGLGNELSRDSLRELRRRAFAYVCNDKGRILSASQHEAIERFVALKQETFTPGIEDKFESDDDGSCNVMIAAGNVFELYGGVPRVAQLSYSIGESRNDLSNDRNDPSNIRDKYPGSVAVICYQFTGI